MILLIDYRETSFIEKIKQYKTKTECMIMDEGDNENNEKEYNEKEGEFIWSNVNVMYKIQNLEIGDFVIKTEDETRVIIERKSIKDLCASIIDGRFREQKERLKESMDDTSRILYIIEGHKKKLQCGNEKGISKMIIDGSILNLMYRHKYKVLQTENESDTFENIILLYKKIKNGEFESDKLCNESPIKITKMIKKGDKISENIMAIQLSVIPGVSYNVSCIISSIYKNMKCLIDAYNGCENEILREKLLMDIEITNKRRLGVSLSKKIYESIMK
jgi:crossover junction endonuclease MUS81